MEQDDMFGVDDALIAAGISAGGNLLGGFLGKSSADKNAERNIQLQKEFAKNGIRWKVADARAAGVSPIYALGAQTNSFSPVSVGDPLGSGIAAAGQDIGRAINAGSTQPERQSAFSTAVQSLQLDGMKLDNDIKRQELLSKIATRNATGIPPAIPTLDEHFIAGQGNAEDPFKVQKQISASEPGKPESEAGVNPEVSWYTGKEGMLPMPPQALGDALDSVPIEGWNWWIRNRMAPMVVPSSFNPPYKAPADKYWTYDPLFGYKLNDRVFPRTHFMYPQEFFNDGRG